MRRFRPDSVAAKVAGALRQMAEEAGPGARLPSVRTLRSDLNISHAPLEAALGQLEREGVIERRQGAGVFVKERITVSRCAIIFDSHFLYGGGLSPFWPLLLRALMTAGVERGWEPVLHLPLAGSYLNTPDHVEKGALPMNLVNELTDGHVRGVIAIGLPQSVFNFINQFKVPISAFAGYGRRRVEMRGSIFLRMAIEAAAEDGFTGLTMLDRRSWDEEQVEATAREYGLDGKVLEVGTEGVGSFRDNLKDGYDASWLVDRESLQHSALVCGTDMVSLGLLMGLRRRGLEPRRDFGLYTHANRGSSVLLGWDDDIVSIEYDPEVVATMLFDLLEGDIRGRMPRHAELAATSPVSTGPDWCSVCRPTVRRAWERHGLDAPVSGL